MEKKNYIYRIIVYKIYGKHGQSFIGNILSGDKQRSDCGLAKEIRGYLPGSKHIFIRQWTLSLSALSRHVINYN